jgi:hypothetical protein
MSEIKIDLSSPPDRNQLVASILINQVQIAEISNESSEKVIIEIYPQPNGGPWRVEYTEFIKAVITAKERLLI